MVFRKIEGIILFCLLIIIIFLAIYLFNPSLTARVISNPSDSLSSPKGFVENDQIKADEEKVIIYINNSVLSRYSSSMSMFPLINENSTGIGFRPNSERDIQEGDIVSFWDEEILIVHRVIKKGLDKEGVYFITKGDNNFFEDEKIRFSDIDSVLVGIIY